MKLPSWHCCSVVCFIVASGTLGQGADGPVQVRDELQQLTREQSVGLLLKSIREIPDCRFEYTVEVLGERRHFEFAKFEEKFYFRRVTASGDVLEAVAFNGIKYTVLYENGYMVQSSRSEVFSRFLSSLFVFNPLYNGANFMQFEYQERFLLPDLEVAEAWADALKLSTLKTEISNETQFLHCATEQSKLDFQIDGHFLIKKITGFVEKDWKVDWKLNEVMSRKPAIPFDIPLSIDCKYFEDDQTLPSKYSYKIRLDESTFALLERYDENLFKIPMSAGRTIYDADKKLNLKTEDAK